MTEEVATIYIKAMINEMLSMYALMNMYKSSGNKEYFKSAEKWIPFIDSTFTSLRDEMLRIGKEND